MDALQGEEQSKDRRVHRTGARTLEARGARGNHSRTRGVLRVRFRDLAALALAAVLIVTGLALMWYPLGIVSAGVVIGAGWYWLIDEDGGEQ